MTPGSVPNPIHRPRAPKPGHASPRAWPGSSRAFALLLLFLLPLTPSARADALKLSGIWLNDVQVIALRGGTLSYQSSTGAVIDKPVAEVEAARFDEAPQYAEAVALLDAGDAKAALPLLDRAASAAKSPWTKTYVAAARWRALAQAGDAKASVRAYLDLAAAGADPHFLADPPIVVVTDAPAAARRDIATMIRTAMPRVPDAVKPHLQSMLDIAAAPESTPAEGASAPVSPAPAPDSQTPERASAPEPASAPASGVVLPIKLADSPATKLLREGRFADARAQIDRDLKQEGGLAVDLYLLGIAQLYEADRTGDANGYLDAGLAFMRVVVYFPRSDFAGRNLVGGSLLELAYIHDKLGRGEKAVELYARAAARLDAASDPNLHQRLERLRAARP